MRFTKAAVAVVALSLLAAACSSDKKNSGASGSGGGGGGGGGKTGLVGVDYPRSDSDFWNSYIKYVPQFGKQMGLDLKTSNSENDIAKLTANVQALIGQGVKGVVLAPQDTAAVAPTLDQLKQKKIPVVTV
ncbi:MAG TPA: substrate-binding domain-containing protein, partial [Jatrophihabitantaceae bacterium]|nr:substrate-binding domain-containing protein [Jatrophihabitantaceae bacterium]